MIHWNLRAGPAKHQFIVSTTAGHPENQDVPGVGTLHGAVLNQLGNDHQHGADSHPYQEQLPHEPHPAVIGHVGGAQNAHQGGGGGQDVVAEAVAEVETQDAGLTGDTQQIGKGGS